MSLAAANIGWGWLPQTGTGGSGGGGTVTSFSAGNLNPLFTTNVDSPNTTPSLTFALNNQSANLVFAGPPTGAAAAPTFRALVAADINGLVPLSSLIAATGNNTINNVAHAQVWQWNSLAGGTGMSFTSTSTAATGNTQRLVSMSLSGTNTNNNQITTTLYIENIHVSSGNTARNVALHLKASGNSTTPYQQNIALYIEGDVLFPDAQNGITWGSAIDIGSSTSRVHADTNNLYVRGKQMLYLGTGTNTGITIVSPRVYVGGVGSPTAFLHLAGGLSSANFAPLKFTAGTNMLTAEAGAMEYNGNLFFTNGTGVRQRVMTSQTSYVTSNFSVNNSSTLTNVTGLTANVAAGATYRFLVIVYGTCDSTGGMKLAIGGTATATSIIYQAQFGEATGSGNPVYYSGRATSLGTGVNVGSGSTEPYVILSGTITVNSAGTITVQMAEEVATATATILAGSVFFLTQIS